MKGAIIGDIAGSIYEFDETAESLDFPLFVKNSRFTDDTVTTVAVAAALMEGKASCCGYIEPLRRQLRYWCRKYPDAGFGGLFRRWLGDQIGEARTFLALSIARGTANDLYDLGQATAVANSQCMFAIWPVEALFGHTQCDDDIHGIDITTSLIRQISCQLITIILIIVYKVSYL